jgi:sarcosine oxidase gamma subunit
MKHPRYDDFTFIVKDRYEDGTRYITCAEMEGFRLLVRADEDMVETISEALTFYLPLHDEYLAKKAERERDSMGPDNAP